MMLRILAWLGGSVLALIALLAALFWYFVYSPAPEPPQLSGAWTRTVIESGGRERSYRVYAPDNLAQGAPLVVVLHSSDGNAAQIRRATGYGFDRLADLHGFAVAYPQGFEGNWNACNRTGDYSANTLNIDDVAFISAMIDEIARGHGIDVDRVFAVGLSRGGHMAFRLALEAPNRFRAVAAVAANLPTQDNLKCQVPDEPIPSVMLMNGTADPLNPFEGGRVRLLGLFDRGTVISSAATAEYFAELAGASRSESAIQNFGRVQIENTRWRGEGGVEVQLSAVEGAGHVMPQAYWRNPRILGHTPREIDGPAEIWSFFERQP
jgi:polyhydroxybutyrate depolymerase